VSTRHPLEVSTICALPALLGKRVSRSTVSRVTRRLEDQVEDLRREPITGLVAYLYLDATLIDARSARIVENVSALVAYGVGPDGHRRLLAVHIGTQESEASWAGLLGELVERGLSGVRLVIADDHAGLRAAARKTLPEARQQRCTVHLMRNVLSNVPRRHQRRLAREIVAVLHADSLDAARKALRSSASASRASLPITYLENHRGDLDYARLEATGCRSAAPTSRRPARASSRCGSSDRAAAGRKSVAHIVDLRALAISDRWGAAMKLTIAPLRAEVTRPTPPLSRTRLRAADRDSSGLATRSRELHPTHLRLGGGPGGRRLVGGAFLTYLSNQRSSS
jgi:hypothetical protein